ncbi:MAG: GNAT family N-acetyltransferase [Anaerolineae bacterium]|nr:GNAT family N-acetyltransferase [Anaerolineae bacterium]
MSDWFVPQAQEVTQDLAELRRKVRTMLDLSAPRDGLAAYYVLYYDPARTRLWVAERGPRVEGFLAICQTGWDLFRPLSVLRARRIDVAHALLERGFSPSGGGLPYRPYYLVTTPDLLGIVEEALEVERVSMNRIYYLDLRRYEPEMNVLVTPTPSASGSPRFVVRSQGAQIVAEAGINWRSPHFAEVYVHTAPEAQQRGWGKAVLDACVTWILRSGAVPLYVVAEGNESSARLAESVGFVDSGARECAIEGIAKA